MKRILTIVLSIVLLIGCLPVSASADGQALGMASVGSGGYKTMTTSQKMLDVLKVMEGFHATPYYDYSQYTVGYGSYAASRDMEVTPEEAEELMITQLREGYVTANGTKQKGYEQYVNDFCKKIGKQPNQNQFDALVSFTYNLGAGWMNSSRLATWLKNPSTEMELVNAMGQWCRAGGKLMFSLAQRRIREAIIFLKGEYYYHSAPTAEHNVKSDLKVVTNDKLPYYASVIYQYNYDTGSVKMGYGHAVEYFAYGTSYGTLPVLKRDGHEFSGWMITKINNGSDDSGTRVTTNTIVEKNLELTAVWDKGPYQEEPPVKDPEPTEPEPTTPVPSEPTTPKPTEPAPSEPTEPTPSDPGDIPFTDVKTDDWFYESVDFVYEHGLMNGTGETTFAPEITMTRGMLVTVLYRMEGSPEVTDEERAVFDDTSGAFYTDAVAWAKSNGVVNGVSDREFRPNDEVTREQAVTIFYRYCVEYCQIGGGQTVELDGQFADADKVSDFAVDAMKWSAAVELITGIPADGAVYLQPKGKLSRAQSATILMRCVEDILLSGV